MRPATITFSFAEFRFQYHILQKAFLDAQAPTIQQYFHFDIHNTLVNS